MEYCRRKYLEAYNLLDWDSADEEDATKKADQGKRLEKEKKRKAVNSRKKTVGIPLCMICKI